MATSKPTIVRLEHLKSWFENQGSPYFRLYYGHISNQRGSNRNNHYIKNDEGDGVDNISDAWNLLQENLLQVKRNGAQFTLMVKEGTTNNYAKAYFEFEQMALSPSVNGPQQVGISQAQVNQQIQDALRMERLERERDDALQLAETIRSPRTIDRFIDGLVDKFPDVVDGVMGYLAMASPSVSAPAPIHGPSHTPAIPPSNTDQIEAPKVEEGSEKVSAVATEMTPEQIEEVNAKMTAVLSIFHTHFGDDSVNVLLKLAHFVDKDPAKAKSMLNFL